MEQKNHIANLPCPSFQQSDARRQLHLSNAEWVTLVREQRSFTSLIRISAANCTNAKLLHCIKKMKNKQEDVHNMSIWL